MSAATRPSSRATIATSTPDASGASSSPGPRRSNQPALGAGRGQAGLPVAVVEVDDGARAEVGDQRRGRGPQLQLFG